VQIIDADSGHSKDAQHRVLWKQHKSTWTWIWRWQANYEIKLFGTTIWIFRAPKK